MAFLRWIPRWGLAGVAIAGMASAGGCAAPARGRRDAIALQVAAHQRRQALPAQLSPPVSATGGGARGPSSTGTTGAALIVTRLHAAGFRFGTDGSVGALWGYMRTAQAVVQPHEARPGDLVFFDTRSRDEEAPSCADRVGIVEAVAPNGRITFFEAEPHGLRRGYVHPRFPLLRRDERGEIVNSFLRPKRIGDVDGTRYFAGEMLCGVARVRSR